MKKWFFLLLSVCLTLTAACAEDAAESGFLIVENGMMQPVLTYSDLRDPNYTNEDSDILRFCVYVETDYDTDFDGKADLVKVLVQTPRAAAEGLYQAGVIYDPTPYGAGKAEAYESDVSPLYTEEPFDYDSFDHEAEKREPAGEMTSLEAAAQADPMLWNYTVPYSGSTGYEDAESYNYYLLRGYAVVEACGIGTYGSEGFELCGTRLERDSHRCVVEWLTGDRRAFTDPVNNIEIRADWSNGHVAMTGTSYGGTIPFEVAVTGVQGLETIIPYAGIANWYDYTNSQGVPTRNTVNYADYLAAYNCGGVFLDDEWTVVDPRYGSWLWQIAQDQDATNGDYAPIWEMLDYTTDEENHIECSALIVTGLNDFNVTTRHADLMFRAFRKAGKTVKLVLHQDGHNDLYGISVGGQPWDDIVNLWLSHYLYGIENGAEDMPALLAQSNIDGSFLAYDSWEDAEWVTVWPASETDYTTVTSDGLAQYSQDFQENWQNNLSVEQEAFFYTGMPADLAAVYPLDLPEGITLKGGVEVHVQLDSDRDDLDGLMITAVLMDVSDEGTFEAYQVNSENDLVPTRQLDETYVFGNGLPDVPLAELERTEVSMKCVTFGWTDLQNPGCGYDSSDYIRQEPGLVSGVEQDYTFYMLPTLYTLAQGHHLELYLLTWDAYRVMLDESFDLDGSLTSDLMDYQYQMTIRNDSLEVRIPAEVSSVR